MRDKNLIKKRIDALLDAIDLGEYLMRVRYVRAKKFPLATEELRIIWEAAIKLQPVYGDCLPDDFNPHLYPLLSQGYIGEDGSKHLFGSSLKFWLTDAMAVIENFHTDPLNYRDVMEKAEASVKSGKLWPSAAEGTNRLLLAEAKKLAMDAEVEILN